MDSLNVFLQLPGPAAQQWWGIVFQLIKDLAPFVVAIWVPVYTLRHSHRMKQIDLDEREKDRKHVLSMRVSETALDVMLKSYHIVNNINRAVALEKDPKSLHAMVQQAREYWEEHVFYLPWSARKLMVPMTAKFQAALAGHDTKTSAYSDLFAAFKELEAAFAEVMQEYNLFDKYGTESLAKRTK